MSIRARLTELERRAQERAGHGTGCKCQFIYFNEGEPLTEDQERILEANRKCFERNHNRKYHIGITHIEVARQRHSNYEEDDDSPLIA